MSEERFINRKQALNWLKAQGYKISQGKFYQDVKEGNPPLHQDGSVSKFQVMAYGQQLDIETRAGQLLAGEDREYSIKKEKAEAEIAEMKAERMRRDEDALWLHAEQAYGQMAAIIGTLRDSLRHHIYTKQSDIVVTAGGNLDRSQETYEAIDDIIGQAFNEVAGGDVNITFARES